MAEISSYGKIKLQKLVRNSIQIMSDQTLNPRSPIARESEIEVLARETGVPVEAVQEIYRVERDKLERSARIKTYIPVLAHRRVKALLQVERGRRH